MHKNHPPGQEKFALVVHPERSQKYGRRPLVKTERAFLAQLKSVSRSFYLTLRVLPAGARLPIAIAYLLARAADTIADSTEVSAAQRLAVLITLRGVLEDPSRQADIVTPSLIKGIKDPAERCLLKSIPFVLSEFYSVGAQDKAAIANVVNVLISGMELDMQRFHHAPKAQPIALANDSELDDYIYRVAGCVGAFWTEIISRYDKALSHWDVAAMSEQGVRYGKALQLTNILRDLPEDLSEGRCYLPLDELCAAALTPQQLLDAEKSNAVKPIIHKWLRKALAYYGEAEQYVLAIPWYCFRLRLAALWPLLIGLATLAKLARFGCYLDASQRIKVARPWVYRMMILSIFCVVSNRLIKIWIADLRQQIEQAIIDS